jgi:rod shape-determining protein MreC
MAVITVQGIVGKVLKVFRSTAQVLLIDDQSSGVGAILDKSRLQGIVRGTSAGEVVLEKIMSDESVQPGEEVRTSGGDRIFPKGLPIGVVTRVSNSPDFFLNIHVRPSADLHKLEEVLVVTQVVEKESAPSENTSVRAVDILAQRLPSVPDKPADDPNKPRTGTTTGAAAGATTGAATAIPGAVPSAKPAPATANPAPGVAKTSPASGDTAKPAVASSSMLKPGSTAPPTKTPNEPKAGTQTKVAPSEAPPVTGSATAKPKPVKPAPDQSQPAPAQDQPQ